MGRRKPKKSKAKAGKKKVKSQKPAKLRKKQPAEAKAPSSAYSVALAQINTVTGDLNANTQKILSTIEQARQRGVHILIFPELTITGQCPKDLLQRPDFVDLNMQKFIEIVNACRGISCIFGFVNKVNGVLYNALAVVKDQKILSIENKMHLNPEELLYFVSGKQGNIVQLGNARIGVVLCHSLVDEQGYIGQLVDQGVDFIVVVSASPYVLRRPEEREQMAILLAKKHQVPLLFCNAVGGHDGIIFDGSSFIVDKKGLIAGRAKKFAEEVLVVQTNAVGKEFTPPVNQAAEVYHALTMGLRDYFAKSGFTKAVIGISGGLDSAVTAVLAVHALGAEHIVGLSLPSKISSNESIKDAKQLCNNLHIPLHVIKIDPLVLPTARALGLAYDKKKISLTEQNIQARARAQLLMGYANKESGLVLSSVNKSSLAVGYCTLYGDMVGALAPLGDLWKIQVRSLAEFINALWKKKHNKVVIPLSILKKIPSAELRPGQKDSDDIPEYDILDKALQFYVVNKKDIHQIGKLGIDHELVRQIALMVHRNEFKRQQMPLVLVVSGSGLGTLPVVSGWRG